MDIDHSMNQQSYIMWHLDPEASVEDVKDDPTETRGLRQPWRSYWPPKCEKMMQIWLYSEFPEVLSWRFDHRQPFDRPWRTWTRSARALEERATSLPCRPMGTRRGKQLISCSPRIVNNSLQPPQTHVSRKKFQPKVQGHQVMLTASSRIPIFTPSNPLYFIS
jgi:hypothetical protein